MFEYEIRSLKNTNHCCTVCFQELTHGTNPLNRLHRISDFFCVLFQAIVSYKMVVTIVMSMLKPTYTLGGSKFFLILIRIRAEKLLPYVNLKSEISALKHSQKT